MSLELILYSVSELEFHIDSMMMQISHELYYTLIMWGNWRKNFKAKAGTENI